MFTKDQKVNQERSTIIIYKYRFNESNVFIRTYNQKPYNYEYPHAEIRQLLLDKTDIKESDSWVNSNYWKYPTNKNLPCWLQLLLSKYKI